MRIKEALRKIDLFSYSIYAKMLLSALCLSASAYSFFKEEYVAGSALLALWFSFLSNWTLETILREYHSHLLHFHNCTGYALNQIGYFYDEKDKEIQHALLLGPDQHGVFTAEGKFVSHDQLH